jgi:hypothetical protein
MEKRRFFRRFSSYPAAFFLSGIPSRQGTFTWHFRSRSGARASPYDVQVAGTRGMFFPALHADGANGQFFYAGAAEGAVFVKPGIGTFFLSAVRPSSPRCEAAADSLFGDEAPAQAEGTQAADMGHVALGPVAGEGNARPEGFA